MQELFLTEEQVNNLKEEVAEWVHHEIVDMYQNAISNGEIEDDCTLQNYMDQNFYNVPQLQTNLTGGYILKSELNYFLKPNVIKGLLK